MRKVEVENLSLVIGKKTILDNISFDVDAGKIIGVVGRNGSGKTMLMKCICGFVLPTAGHINVDGKEIGVDIDFPKSTGIIIEAPGFIPNYSGLKNLRELARLRTKISDEDLKVVLEQVGLDPELSLAVKKYSLGMRQRLGIAQAIMEKPDLLILDEPFNGLDEDGVTTIRELLLSYKKSNKTIILASHIKEDIDVLCDEVIHLEKGKIK